MLRRSSAAAAAGDTAPYAELAEDSEERENRPNSRSGPARTAGKPNREPRGARDTSRSGAAALQVLKDELFELEADRVSGRITLQDYAEHKAALDLMIGRALRRIEGETSASNE